MRATFSTPHGTRVAVMIRPRHGRDAAGVAAIWNHYIRDTAVTFNPVEKTVAEVAEMIADAAAACLRGRAERADRGLCDLWRSSAAAWAIPAAMEHSILLAPGAHGRALAARC